MRGWGAGGGRWTNRAKSTTNHKYKMTESTRQSIHKCNRWNFICNVKTFVLQCRSWISLIIKELLSSKINPVFQPQNTRKRWVYLIKYLKWTSFDIVVGQVWSDIVLFDISVIHESAGLSHAHCSVLVRKHTHFAAALHLMFLHCSCFFYTHISWLNA